MENKCKVMEDEEWNSDGGWSEDEVNDGVEESKDERWSDDEDNGGVEDERWSDDEYDEDTNVRREKICKKEADKLEYLTKEEVLTEMKQSVERAVSCTQKSATEMRLLLNKYKWNTEQLLEHYYNTEEVDEVASSCPPTEFKYSEGDCEICWDRFSRVEMAALNCGHFFCKSCWSVYIKERVLDHGKDVIGCPAHGCSALSEDETVLGLVDDASIHARYKMLIVENFIQNNESLIWCTSADCIYVIKMNSFGARVINCKCGERFCSGCKLIDHEPIRCDLYKKWLNNPIKGCPIYIKECPRCHTQMEKNGGCNHMTCSRCHHHFCWMCLGDWSMHNNSYKCNAFPLTNQDLKQIQDSAIYQKAVTRLSFYKGRHDEHNRSIALEKKIEPKVEHIFMNSRSRDPRLLACLTILRECRLTLMHSFAFAFFLEDSSQKEIFESNQNFLERAVEQLSRSLELDLKNDYMRIKKLQETIMTAIDQSQLCRKRQKEMIDHASEGYDKGYWQFGEFNFEDMIRYAKHS